MKDEFGMPIIPSSREIKKLIDLLLKESKGYTEFRVVVNEDGTAYAHVLGRDSLTVNFKLKDRDKI